MLNKKTEKWLDQMREKGYSDTRIREQLEQSGWSKTQIDAALFTNRDAEVQRIASLPTGPEVPPPSKRNFAVLGIVAAVIVAVALVGAGFYYGFPWESDSNTNTGTVINGYNSNVGTYTGTGTGWEDYEAQLAAQSNIGKFENYDQISDFLSDHASTGSGFSSYAPSMSRSMMVEESMPMSDTTGETFGLGVADLKQGVSLPNPLGTSGDELDYSTTNIQVEGVDEADIVKTDGQHVYAVSDKNVYIIDAYPGEDAGILSTISLESTPMDIYVNGDSLVIYGRENNLYDKPYYDSIRSYSQYTFFKVFDISDRTQPEQKRDLTFEGYHTNSRMIGDYVYFVTARQAEYADTDIPIPYVIENDVVLSTDSTVAGCNCPDVYYIDAYYPSYTYTSVHAINVKDHAEDISGDIYLLGSSDNMYVSPNNIYLVYTKYVSEMQIMFDALKDVLWDDLSETDKSRIEEIESVPNYILSPDEKVMKVYMIFAKYEDIYDYYGSDDEDSEAFRKEFAEALTARYQDISKEMEKTVIHKVAIDGGDLEYQASGEVTGHVLNQFSMDESGDYFRIATTKGRSWSGGWMLSDLADELGMEDSSDLFESYSNVYVLDADLQVVGSLERLAETEEIYSARFMQNRVYLVTFRQTDPLFAIDLSNPKEPTVLGELKIPGFSSYLHPYDDSLLIGFGKDADEDGRVKGLKLSLFDVSDVDNLKEVDTFTMGDRGSDSIALNDHKAFLFSKDKNLLVIPVTLQEEIGDNTYRYNYTHGAMVFEITPEGFSLRKQIDHSDGSDDDSDSRYYYGYYYYGTTVKRSLYIEDVLYTVSDKYLKMNRLEDLDEVNEVTLTTSDSDDYTIITPE